MPADVDLVVGPNNTDPSAANVSQSITVGAGDSIYLIGVHSTSGYTPPATMVCTAWPGSPAGSPPTILQIGASVDDSGGGQGYDQFYVVNPGAGTYTFQYASVDSGTHWLDMRVARMLEIATSSPLLAFSGRYQNNPSTSADAVNSGTAQTPSPATYPCLMVAVSTDSQAGVTPDAGSGMTSKDVGFANFGGAGGRLVVKRLTSGDAQALFTSPAGATRDITTVMAVFAEAASGGAADPILARVETAADIVPRESFLRRLVNVVALVAIAGGASTQVPQLRRSLAETPLQDQQIRRLRRLPESVDQPTFLLWSGFEDDAQRSGERVQSARRLAFQQEQAPADTAPWVRARVAPGGLVDETRIRLLKRLPESVDQPPIPRSRQAFDTPREDIRSRLLWHSPESVDAPPGPRDQVSLDPLPEETRIRLRIRVPESVDQPLLSRRGTIVETLPEADRIKRALKLPDALVSVVDQPPAPRWETVSDTPNEDVRSARGRWVLPSGAAPAPDQPLARWRTALESPLEEARVRSLRRLPESVDQPVLGRPRSATEGPTDEPRIRLEPSTAWSFIVAPDQPLVAMRRSALDTLADEPLSRRQRRLPESVDAPPLVRWRNVFDATPGEPPLRQLRRLPESYVPPPVDDAPQARWRTTADTPLEELPLRHLRLLLETGPAVGVPPLYRSVTVTAFAVHVTPTSRIT